MPGTVLGAGDISMNKIDSVPGLKVWGDRELKKTIKRI